MGIRFKSCPRCIIGDQDEYEEDRHILRICVQCGHRQYIGLNTREQERVDRWISDKSQAPSQG